MRTLLTLLLISAMLLGQTTPQMALPRGTGIEIELLHDLSSETMQAGQEVKFRIVSPVELKGQTIFPADTPVTGNIGLVKSAGKWGKNGAISLTLNPLVAPDGSSVPIDFHRPARQSQRGEKAGERMEAAIYYGYYFPLIPIAVIRASRKGKPFTIRKGERYLVYVVASGDQPTFNTTQQPTP